MQMTYSVKREINAIFSNKNNKTVIKDVGLLFIATILFHCLYWYSDMNSWIFGPFTSQVYDFFRYLAFKLSLIPCSAFIKHPFDIADTAFNFYTLNPEGIKVYDSQMEINIDCSGVKQLLQWMLIMVLCRGNWKKKLLWFIGGCIIILFFNVVRIFLLTWIFSDYPQSFQFIHDWIARPMMYVIIFAMWWLWITYFAKSKVETKSEK